MGATVRNDGMVRQGSGFAARSEPLFSKYLVTGKTYRTVLSSRKAISIRSTRHCGIQPAASTSNSIASIVITFAIS